MKSYYLTSIVVGAISGEVSVLVVVVGDRIVEVVGEIVVVGEMSVEVVGEIVVVGEMSVEVVGEIVVVGDSSRVSVLIVVAGAINDFSALIAGEITAASCNRFALSVVNAPACGTSVRTVVLSAVAPSAISAAPSVARVLVPGAMARAPGDFSAPGLPSSDLSAAWSPV